MTAPELEGPPRHESKQQELSEEEEESPTESLPVKEISIVEPVPVLESNKPVSESNDDEDDEDEDVDEEYDSDDDVSTHV